MYVYVVGLENKPYFKVGFTDNIGRRLLAMQTGNPFRVVCYSYVDLDTQDKAREVEKKAHDKLRKYSVSGEWFSCSYATVESALDNAANGTKFIDYDEFDQKLNNHVLDIDTTPTLFEKYAVFYLTLYVLLQQVIILSK